MKTLKWILVVLGAIAFGIGLYMVINLSMDMRTIMGAANANKSVNVLQNPMRTIWIVGGVSLGAGLLLGLGAGLPRRTSSSVRKETLRGAAERREQAIRENALRRAGTAPATAGTTMAGEQAPELPSGEDAGAEGRELTAGESGKDQDA